MLDWAPPVTNSLATVTLTVFGEAMPYSSTLLGHSLVRKRTSMPARPPEDEASVLPDLPIVVTTMSRPSSWRRTRNQGPAELTLMYLLAWAGISNVLVV